MKWQEALRQGSAIPDFEDFLRKLGEQAQRQLETAPTWEATLQARGEKLLLDCIRRNVTLDAKEKEIHARAFGPRPEAP